MAGKESFSHLVELKARLFLFAVFAILSLFALRLGYLQLSKGDYYQFLSQNNSRRQVATIPPRGIIVDRRGRVLAPGRGRGPRAARPRAPACSGPHPQPRAAELGRHRETEREDNDHEPPHGAASGSSAMAIGSLSVARS